MLRRTFSRLFSQTPFSTKSLKITKSTTAMKVDVDNSNLLFGHDFSTHMAIAEYTQSDGWAAPIIKPFENFQIHPANSTIHYSLSCFEGNFKKSSKNRFKFITLCHDKKHIKMSFIRFLHILYPDYSLKSGKIAHTITLKTKDWKFSWG